MNTKNQKVKEKRKTATHTHTRLLLFLSKEHSFSKTLHQVKKPYGIKNKSKKSVRRISKPLSECLEAHDESRKAAQKNLHEICEGLKGQIKELEGKVAKELEEKFTAEDRRLQSAYENLQKDGGEDISKMIQKAKAELLVMQSYELVDHSLGEDMDEDEDEENEEESDEDMDEDEDEENEEDEDDEGDESDESDEEPMRKKLKSEGGENEEPFDLSSLCELKTERRAVPEMVELMKPTNVRVSETSKGDNLSPVHLP